MTHELRDYRKVEYKLDENTVINSYEMNAYNVPFAGNTSTCRETFVNGERLLQFSVTGDMSFNQLMHKPVFRDELIEYMYSISRQLVSMVQNGMSLEKVVLDTNNMFVRLSDFNIQLLYLPLEYTFEKKDIVSFVRCLLSELVYAHTPAVECANQIMDYFDEHSKFDVYHFNSFVTEMRSTSKLLTIQEVKDRREVPANSGEKSKEQAIKTAHEAAKRAEQARAAAEDEVRRNNEEARQQAEKARQAEELRVRAEAARVEAEIMRQKAEEETRDYEETAILVGSDYGNMSEYNDDKRIQAEVMYRNAQAERQKAEQMSSRYADEIRRARDQEMKAEEARIQAEFAAKKNAEEARKQAEVARRQEEEAKRLSEETTVVFDSHTYNSENVPVLTRKNTGERILINKQVFCLGKADQGVDFKITCNKSISRRHAYITSINGVNYIRDNNSTNHTYLNGTQVYSNIDVAIPNNSIIRLSNEEFLFQKN